MTAAAFAAVPDWKRQLDAIVAAYLRETGSPEAARAVEVERLRLYDKEHLHALIVGGELASAVHYVRQFEAFGKNTVQDVTMLLCKQHVLENLHTAQRAKALDAFELQVAARVVFEPLASDKRFLGEIKRLVPLCDGRVPWRELADLIVVNQAPGAEPSLFRKPLAEKIRLVMEKGLDLDRVTLTRPAVGSERLMALVLQALDFQCHQCHAGKRNPKKHKIHLARDHSCREDDAARAAEAAAKAAEDAAKAEQLAAKRAEEAAARKAVEKAEAAAKAAAKAAKQKASKRKSAAASDPEASSPPAADEASDTVSDKRSDDDFREPPAAVAAAAKPAPAKKGAAAVAAVATPTTTSKAKGKAAAKASKVSASAAAEPAIEPAAEAPVDVKVELKVAAGDPRKFHHADELFERPVESELPVPTGVVALSVGTIDADVSKDPSASPLLVAFESGVVRLYSSVRANAPFATLPPVEQGVIERLIWGPDAEHFVVQLGKPAAMQCYTWNCRRPEAPPTRRSIISFDNELADACAALQHPFRVMVANHDKMLMHLVSAVTGAKVAIELDSYVSIAPPTICAAAVMDDKDIIVAGGQLKAKISARTGYVILIRNGEKLPFSQVKFDYVPKAMLAHDNVVLISTKAAIYTISLTDPHVVPMRLFDVREALLQGGAVLCALPGGSRLVAMSSNALVSLGRSDARVSAVHSSLGLGERGPLVASAGRGVAAVSAPRRQSIMIACGHTAGTVAQLLKSATPDDGAASLAAAQLDAANKDRSRSRKRRLARKRPSSARLQLESALEVAFDSCRVATVYEAAGTAPFDCVAMSLDGRLLLGYAGAARSLVVFKYAGANWSAATTSSAWTESPPMALSLQAHIKAADAAGWAPRFVGQRFIEHKFARGRLALCTRDQVLVMRVFEEIDPTLLLAVKQEKQESDGGIEPLIASPEQADHAVAAAAAVVPKPAAAAAAVAVSAAAAAAAAVGKMRLVPPNKDGAPQRDTEVQRYVQKCGNVVCCALVTRSQVAVALATGETRLVNVAGSEPTETALGHERRNVRPLLIEVISRAHGRDIVSVQLQEHKRLLVHKWPLMRVSESKTFKLRFNSVYRDALLAGGELCVDVGTRDSKLMLLVGCARRFCLLRIETGVADDRALPDGSTIASLAFSNDALMAFVAQKSGDVAVYDVRSMLPLVRVVVPSLHKIAAHPIVPELFFATLTNGSVQLVGPGSGHNTWYSTGGLGDEMTESALAAAEGCAAALDGDRSDAELLRSRKPTSAAAAASQLSATQRNVRRGDTISRPKRVAASDDEDDNDGDNTAEDDDDDDDDNDEDDKLGGGKKRRAESARSSRAASSARRGRPAKKRVVTIKDSIDDEIKDLVDTNGISDSESGEDSPAKKRARRLVSITKPLPTRQAKLLARQTLRNDSDDDSDGDIPIGGGDDDDSTENAFTTLSSTSEDESIVDSD